nr:SCO2524 family protein [Cryptosporangium phraense]
MEVFDLDSPEARDLCAMVNQTGAPPQAVAAALQHELSDVRAGLRDLTIGTGRNLHLANPNLLFSCGWTWGVTADAPKVEVAPPWDRHHQPAGIAVASPHPYFTRLACAGIADATSETTRVQGLLHDEQQRIATALQLRLDLARRYWGTLAMFGDARWPVEDQPWHLPDGASGDQITLSVIRLTGNDLSARPHLPKDDQRFASLLRDFASRTRVWDRIDEPGSAPPAYAQYSVDLAGSDTRGPALRWPIELAPSLMKAALTSASTTTSGADREALLALAEAIWDRLATQRRLPNGLWGAPSKDPDDGPSWSLTEQIMECLVVMAEAAAEPLPVSDLLTSIARDLLNEATHGLDRVLLDPQSDSAGTGTDFTALRTTLDEAGRALDREPGLTMTLAQDVIRALYRSRREGKAAHDR